MKVSSTRNAIMYSRTRFVTDVQLAQMHSGVRNADRTTKNSEIPSTPIAKAI